MVKRTSLFTIWYCRQYDQRGGLIIDKIKRTFKFSLILYFYCMYTKQQASQLRHEFWTAFGLYMSPILSADGEKINWVNYKTGEKHLFFKLEADQQFASIGIEMTHPALDMQKAYFDHFLQLQVMLNEAVGEKWDWVLHTTNENSKVVSKIFIEIAGKNIFNKEDWPALISFFKPRLIALDAFWCGVKDSFQMIG